ncbi:MAG: VWA domain-containing protein [Sphingomonas sp.]
MLLLDTSRSMAGAPIAELNEGLGVFRAQLASDPLAAKRVDVMLITFGPVEIVSEFGSVDMFQPPRLVADGDTPMGEAIARALDLLKARKVQYRESGIPYYRPWIFLISDGSPTDQWSKAARLISEGEERKQLTFYAVGIEGADMATLSAISVRAPLRLKGLAFGELFRWLSNSLRSVSHSSPGDQVALVNPAAPDGWAMID